MCVIGVFDGVHCGHQALLAATAKDALARGAKPVVVTFDHDPDELFCPECVHKLQTNEERIESLRQIIPTVIALPFTQELASKEWREFLDDLLEQLPGLKAIHVGDNFRCGACAGGGIPEIASWGSENDKAVTAHPLFLKDGMPVSASRIRALLAEGEVRKAADLLTRPFTLTGHVIEGAGRGHNLGFATANVEVDGSRATMGPFVYAAYALFGERRYKAAVSIGEPPTYLHESKTFNPFLFEAHLLDFDDSLYGQELTLEFVDKLRPMQKFEQQEELIAAVMGNIAWVRENL